MQRLLALAVALILAACGQADASQEIGPSPCVYNASGYMYCILGAYSVTWPASQGATNSVLANDGSGNLSWSTSANFVSPMTTLGDIIYESATPQAARLAGNTTTSKEYLSQTGSGSISSPPAWSVIDAGDIGTGTLAVARGGTNLGSGNSGAVIAFTASGVLTSSNTLTQYGVIYGGGAGFTPGSSAAGTTGQLFTATTSAAPGWASPGNLTDAGTDGIVITSGTGAIVTNASLAQHVADTTHNGYLASADWNTFNTVTTTPTASTRAGWDANKNLSANMFIASGASTATAAGSTTFVITSAGVQVFTGSTTQTLVLPVATTLVTGQALTIINNSTGILTVNSSGGNTVSSVGPHGSATFYMVQPTGGTGTASWYASYLGETVIVTTNGGTIASGTTHSLATLSIPSAGGWQISAGADLGVPTCTAVNAYNLGVSEQSSTTILGNIAYPDSMGQIQVRAVPINTISSQTVHDYLSISPYVFTTTGAATFYLMISPTYTGGTAVTNGYIQAVRVQ